MAINLPGSDRRNTQITLEDVRDFIVDRTVLDNPLDLDLAFSDEEIEKATRRAAMKFNEINPQVIYVDWRSLPFGYMFLNGIAAELMLTKYQQLAKQDIDYNAGGVTVEIVKRQLEHIKELLVIFKEEFLNRAQTQKNLINYDQAYGHF